MTGRWSALGWPLRAAVTGLLTCVVLAIGSGMAVALGFDGDGPLGRYFGATCVLALLFAIMTAATAVISRGRFVPLMAVAVAAAATGTGLVLYLLVTNGDGQAAPQEAVALAADACLMLGVGLAHNGLLLLVRTHSSLQFAIKVATIICCWTAFAVIVSFPVVEPLITGLRMEIFLALTGVALVLVTALGTIVVPIAAHVRGDQGPAETIAGQLRLALACPLCGERQEVPTGTPRCRRCRARLTVEVEEPRCDCGYPLYRLRGERCPECGREIPPDRRWASMAVLGPGI